jgi:hypothetical protein
MNNTTKLSIYHTAAGYGKIMVPTLVMIRIGNYGYSVPYKDSLWNVESQKCHAHFKSALRNCVIVESIYYLLHAASCYAMSPIV